MRAYDDVRREESSWRKRHKLVPSRASTLGALIAYPIHFL
jgi:hypothetical protein